MSETVINVPGRFNPIEYGTPLANASDIYDEKNQTNIQETLNYQDNEIALQNTKINTLNTTGILIETSDGSLSIHYKIGDIFYKIESSRTNIIKHYYVAKVDGFAGDNINDTSKFEDAGTSSVNALNIKTSIIKGALQGDDAYKVYVNQWIEDHPDLEPTSENGFLEQDEWLESLVGDDAYEIAVEEGFEGSKSEWLASLKGDKGDSGTDAVNPFKGYFNSPSELQTKYPTGVTGDFANVYDSTEDKIYRYIWDASLSTPDWTQALDSSSNPIEVTPDTATFNSGESVINVNIVNDFITGGNTNIASAETVKELNEQLNGSSEEIVGEELVGAGKLIDPTISKNDTYAIIVTPSTDTLTRGTNLGSFVLGLSQHRHKITITGVNDVNQTYIAFFIKDPTTLSNGQYTLQQLKDTGYIDANNTHIYQWCAKGTPRVFDIPQTANYLLIAAFRGSINVIPTSANFIDLAHTDGTNDKLDKLENRVDTLEENIAVLPDMEDSVDELELSLDSIKELLIDDTTVELIPSDFTNLAIYPSDTWKTSLMSNASLYKNVKKGQILHIEGKTDTYKSCIGFVPSVPKNGDEIVFTQGENPYRIGTGESLDVTVENDCILYVWWHPDTLKDVFPTKLTIRTISAKNDDGSVDITRANVNLCDETKMISGTIDNNGDVASGSNKVTDFIKINLGPNSSYQLTQFIHACSIDSNGSFDYNAIKIAVYDATYNFIGFADYTAYIDKQDVENGNYTLFTNAHYVRVEFSASDYSYYVCNANDRNLPEYSKYNQEDLVQTHDFVADKIHNSDGALTKMLQAALSYVGRGAVTDLGYGDSNTAFDQYVNAVECDSWSPDRYEGLKKQINCSGFVQLALQGISFENSRYVLGSDRQNIITNYRFDSKTTYNYHNGVASPNYEGEHNHAIYCSDYGKLYANTLAKYAEDRGFLFKIKDDLSNVEVGDVIFSKIGDTSTYRGIGHMLFAANVRENKDGSKSVDIMQVTGSGVENLASMSTITSRTATYIWAARFPMPISNVDEIDLISSYTNEQIVDVTTSETLLSTLTLTNPLSKANVYTLIGKLSTNPMGKIQPIVKVSGDTFDGNATTLLQRPNGWFVKHIIIRYNEQISNMSDVKVYVKGEEAIEGVNLQLEDLRLYKGYITI